MANPPITIGELTNVPAPQSEIRSNWAQDASGRVVHRFPTTAAMIASNLTDGSLATVAGVLHQRVFGTWREMAFGTSDYADYNANVVQGVALGALAWINRMSRWGRVGKNVAGSFRQTLDIGWAGTAGNGVTVALPVPARAGYSINDPIGVGFITDASAGIQYRAILAFSSSTHCNFRTLASNANNVLGVVDFTAALAQNDTIGGHFNYEAASLF